MLDRFAHVASVDIGDAMRGSGVMDRVIGPVYSPVTRVVGPAVTVSLPTASLKVFSLGLQQTQPGDVVVVNGWAKTKTAFIGGNMCRGLKHRGVAGLIIDGAVKDVSEIRADGFPVFARAVTAGYANGPHVGEVNVPIACGQCVVNPGDIIVADEDGIVVVPPQFTDEVLAAVSARQAEIAASQAVWLAGEVKNVRDIERELRDNGCEFVSTPG